MRAQGGRVIAVGTTSLRLLESAARATLAKAGKTLLVLANRSILDALRDHGIRVPSSCESGTCGSCKVRLLKGEADHRDLALLPEEQEDHIMVCVSRAKSDTLVLDL